MLGFPLVRSTAQRSQDVVDRRSLAGILLPTRCRHFPQFSSVSTGSGKNWCLGSHTLKDAEDRHTIIVLVKRDSVR